MKRGSYQGLDLPLGRGRKAVVTDAKATDRMKEFAGREEQGLLFSLRLPEGTDHRAEIMIREEEFPGSISVYIDSVGRSPSQSLAWKATFEQREDGAVLVQPSLSAGDIEDFLAARLAEAGLLILRKEGKVILGAPLFLDTRKDEREKTRMFVREALVYALVRGEIERRLRYPPGMEPPPIEIPGKTDGGRRGRSRKSRAKPKAAPVAGSKAAALRAAISPPAKPSITKPGAAKLAAVKPQAPAAKPPKSAKGPAKAAVGKPAPAAKSPKPAKGPAKGAPTAKSHPPARSGAASRAAAPRPKKKPAARSGRASGGRKVHQGRR